MPILIFAINNAYVGISVKPDLFNLRDTNS